MSLMEYLIVGISAFFVSTLAGMSGYGTGLLMPIVLAPIVGVQAVVPILSVAGLFNNASRLAAFRSKIAWRLAIQVMLAAIPACLIGATVYTFLDVRQAALAIGTMLLLLIPTRRMLKGKAIGGTSRWSVGGGVLYGFLTGGTPGAGVILIPILMGFGLPGHSVIATDSVIGLVVNLVKVVTFQTRGFLPAEWWGCALVIGLAGVPGAFLARWLVDRMSAQVQYGILDAGVALGGTMLLLRGFGLF